jgi:hypothetical protein
MSEAESQPETRIQATPSPAPAAGGEAKPEYTTEQVVDAIYTIAAAEMQKGTPDHAIVALLMDKGLENETATIVVRNLREARAKVFREAGQKNMLIGGAVCVIGLVVTIGTMAAADAGGKFILAWGAIIFGAIQFFRGLYQMSQASSA